MAISQKGFWWGELSLGCAKLISRKRWHFRMLSLISSLDNHITFSMICISVLKGVTWMMMSGNNRCKCCSETWKTLAALPTLGHMWWQRFHVLRRASSVSGYRLPFPLCMFYFIPLFYTEIQKWDKIYYTPLLWPVLEWCPVCSVAWTLLLLTSVAASSSLWPKTLSLIAGMCGTYFLGTSGTTPVPGKTSGVLKM